MRSGSTIFGGTIFSSPAMVRVLYYLDDITMDVSPFRCIPRSHLSLHAEANPHTRYLSVCCLHTRLPLSTLTTSDCRLP